MKWEYKIEQNTILTTPQLNKLGNEEWELCGIYARTNYPYACDYHFKRPIPDTKIEP